MKCVFCGTELAADAKFCPDCGTVVAAPVSEPAPAPAAPAAPVMTTPAKAEVKLLGPWAYFGLDLLFSIPLIGFILLIVFSVDKNHLNRRNFARSYWCKLIVAVVFYVILAIILSATGVFQEISDLLQYGF